LKETGGWLSSLDKAIQSKIDLYVAFHGCKNEEFKYKGTTYFSIKLNRSIYQKIGRKIGKSFDNRENLNLYLTVIDKVKPDVIHIHGTEQSFGCIIKNTMQPIVVSIQGNLTVYHHKFFSGFEKKYLKIKKRTIKWPLSFFSPGNFKSIYKTYSKLRFNEQEYLKNCKYVIGRTRWDYRISRILAPQSKYYHCDEILRDEFYDKCCNVKVEKDEKIFFTTSSNNFYKGIETIFEAVELLNKGKLNFKWYIAGICKDDLIVHILRKKYDKLILNEIIFLGKLNAKEITSYMANTDIYIMPSHIENSPNNLCEAMLFGLPSIATFAGGTGTLIDDNVNGILIQDGDPWAMAGAIIEIISSPNLISKLRVNARRIALIRHNKEKIVTNLIKIYTSIINEAKN